MDKVQLEKLNLAYKSLTGKDVKHFFCPILLEDKGGQLCGGHVVSEDLGGSQREVIQRHDVDGLYGRIEKNVVQEQKKRDSSESKKLLYHETEFHIGDDVLSHREANQNFPIDFEMQTPFVFQDTAEGVFLVGIGGEELEERISNGETLEMRTDFKTKNLCGVLLHSAHLTMFLLLQYRYALSAGGSQIGGALKSFYLENRGLKIEKVNENSDSYFERWKNYVHQVNSEEFGCFRGTVEDGYFLARILNDAILSYGVLVRTKNALYVIWIMADASEGFTDLISSSYVKMEEEFPREMTLDLCRCHPPDFDNGKLYRRKKPFKVVWNEADGVGALI